jgi:hypothetical protein
MKKLYQFLSFTGLFCAGLFIINMTATASLPGNTVVEQSVSWFKSSVNSDLINPDDNSDSKFILYIADGILNIRYNKPSELANGEVIVYNLLGQEITRKRLEIITINQVPLSVQNTCYIVKITYSGKVHTQKVLPSAD